MSFDAPLLFVVSGPSGSGKGTFLAEIQRLHTDLIRVQTYTTRPKRPNETEADYNFVSRETFEKLQAEEQIFESTRTYDDFLYGSPTRLIRADERVDLMVELEVKGMLRLRALSERRVVSIFIMPPSLEELEARIRARHHEDNFDARIAKAKDQISYAYAYDYVLINEGKDEFLAGADVIVRAERLRRSQLEAVRQRMQFLLET